MYEPVARTVMSPTIPTVTSEFLCHVQVQISSLVLFSWSSWTWPPSPPLHLIVQTASPGCTLSALFHTAHSFPCQPKQNTNGELHLTHIPICKQPPSPKGLPPLLYSWRCWTRFPLKMSPYCLFSLLEAMRPISFYLFIWNLDTTMWCRRVIDIHKLLAQIGYTPHKYVSFESV